MWRVLARSGCRKVVLDGLAIPLEVVAVDSARVAVAALVPANLGHREQKPVLAKRITIRLPHKGSPACPATWSRPGGFRRGAKLVKNDLMRRPTALSCAYWQPVEGPSDHFADSIEPRWARLSNVIERGGLYVCLVGHRILLADLKRPVKGVVISPSVALRARARTGRRSFF